MNQDMTHLRTFERLYKVKPTLDFRSISSRSHIFDFAFWPKELQLAATSHISHEETHIRHMCPRSLRPRKGKLYPVFLYGDWCMHSPGHTWMLELLYRVWNAVLLLVL